MKAPKLRKNESSASFKARVASWEKNTGKKYPKTRFGTTTEDRILAGAVPWRSKLDIPKDYSTDYEDEIKEYSLENLKIPTKESLDEQAIADLTSGKVDPYSMTLPENKVEQVANALNKSKSDTIPEESKAKANTSYEDEHPLSDPDYNPASTKRNQLTSKWTGKEGSRKLTKPTAIQKKLRKAGFTDEKLVKLMIKHRDWKAARR